jgi:Rrf2 family protein
MMIFVSRRALLAIAAVVDIALHARPQPVAAKALSARLGLPPRHLETLLQTLVRAGILKGVRGPRGGYELARERRRISTADILRALAEEEGASPDAIPACRLIDEVVMPRLGAAGEAFAAGLTALTIDDLCRDATARNVADRSPTGSDFTI